MNVLFHCSYNYYCHHELCKLCCYPFDDIILIVVIETAVAHLSQRCRAYIFKSFFCMLFHCHSASCLPLLLGPSHPWVWVCQHRSYSILAHTTSSSMADNYCEWLNFAGSCMSDEQWEVATKTPEAVLSHRSCPWGGHLIKIESKTLSIDK